MAQGRPDKQTVRVFGDRSRFKREVRLRIDRGRNLLDEMTVAEARIRAAKLRNKDESRMKIDFESFMAFDDWFKRLSSWERSVMRLAERHLGDDKARELLPYVFGGWPEEPEDPLAALKLDGEYVRDHVADLEGLLDRLGMRRKITVASTDEGIRLDELRQSGLLDPKLISDYERRFRDARTPLQVRNVLGASKELLEAVFKVTLSRLGEASPPRDVKFDQLAKLVRRALEGRVAPDPSGRDTMQRLQTGLATAESGLSELRNSYGTGHGRAEVHAGLRPRHARLATDIAEAHVRFLVLTLDDLALLPTKGGD